MDMSANKDRMVKTLSEGNQVKKCIIALAPGTGALILKICSGKNGQKMII
jgi:hypothetical protein